MAITVKLPDGQRLELDAASITIGRDPSCRIHLDDAALEPVHARLRKVGGRWLVESHGDWPLVVGTAPAGRTHWLQPEDEIELAGGGPRLVFEPAAETAAPAESEPPPAKPVEKHRDPAADQDAPAAGKLLPLALVLLLAIAAGWWFTRGDATPVARQSQDQPDDKPTPEPPPDKEPAEPPRGKVGLWDPTTDPDPVDPTKEPPGDPPNPPDPPPRDPLPLPQTVAPRLLQTLAGHEHFVSRVAFLSDTRLISTSFDHTVRVWDLADETSRALSGHKAAVTALAVSVDGKQAVTGDRDGRVIAWNLETLEADKQLRTADSSIRQLALLERGQLLVVTLEGIELWDPSASTAPRGLGERAEFSGAAVSADGSRLWAWRQTQLRSFDAALLTPGGSSRELPDEIDSLAVSADGAWFASGARNGRMHVWQPGLDETRVLDAQSAVHDLVFLADARWLASAGQDRQVRLWETARGKLLYSFAGHTAAVRCLAVSPNGRRLASGSTDTSIRVWQLPAPEFDFTALARTDPPVVDPPKTADPVDPPAEPPVQPPAVDPPQKVERAVVPDTQEQLAVRRRIKGLFEAEYKERTADGRRNLARTLLDQGRDPANTGITRYVLLAESHDLASQAADAQLAFAAADALARWYEVDPLALKQEALATAVPAAPPEASAALADQVRAMIRQLITGDQFDVATALIPLGITAARKAQDETLLADVRTLGDQVRQLRREYQRIAKARERLAENPDDAGALGHVGRYLCYYKGDWARGLPKLSRCDDETLSALAARDLKRPEEVDARIALGDAWWDLSRTHRELARENLRAHAVAWYRLALPDAAGLERVRIEKRIGSLEE